MATCLVWLWRVDWVETNFTSTKVFDNREKEFLAHFNNVTDSLTLLRSWDGRNLNEQSPQEDSEGFLRTNKSFFTMYSPSNGKCLDAVPELGKAALRACSSSLTQYWRWMGEIRLITHPSFQGGRLKFYSQATAGRMISSAKYPGFCLSYAGALRDCDMGAEPFEGALHWRCNSSNLALEDNSRSVEMPGFPLRIPFDDQPPTKRAINTVLKDSLKRSPYVPGATRWFDSTTGKHVCEFY